MISFARKWNALQIKITGQDRIPVKITISIRKNSDARMFLAPFLPLNNSCLFLLLSLAQFVSLSMAFFTKLLLNLFT